MKEARCAASLAVWLHGLLTVLPGLWLAWAHALAVCARMKLGRWPVASLDDPKDLFGVVALSEPLQVVVMISSLGPWLILTGWLWPGWGAGRRLGVVAAYLTVLTGAAAGAALDPGQVLAWLGD